MERAKFYLEILRNLHYCSFDVKNGIEVLTNETFKNHLAQLGSSAPVDPSELSYALTFVERSLSPIIHKNGTSKEIAVCSMAIGENYRRTVQKCLDSHEAYWRQRGYDYVRLDEGPASMRRHPAWYKIPLALRAMSLGYRHVAFIDADAMVTDFGRPLEKYGAMLGESQLLYIAEDDGGINTGVFVLRNTPDAIRLLDLIWLNDLGPYRLWEQAALRSLMVRYQQVRKRISIADPATGLNAFPRERENYLFSSQARSWTEGDFVCHFSGIRGDKLEGLIAQYQKQLGKSS